MSLKNLILEDMKNYMKGKNEVALNTIRLLRADIKNAEIDKREQLDDDEIINLVKSSIKKRKEAIELYKKGNRIELVNKETEEMKVLERYLPEQLDEVAIRKIIEETIKEVGGSEKKYFGEIMKKVMIKTKNKADGALVNKLVREYTDAT